MKQIALIAVPLFFPTVALADITTIMNAYDRIPHVVIRQGKLKDDCTANTKVYDNDMKKGYSKSWSGTGTGADLICWARSKNINDQSSPLDIWHFCTDDGICEIK